MSATILDGDWTIYYEADNRQKRIEFTGSAGETNTVNELYSALQDHFDDLTQLDDGTPLSAQTPTEYTIGIIDAGDDDPWFIDPESVEHLTGGALKTASWTRSEGSNTGIVRIGRTGSNIVAGDIGNTIVTDTDGDSGTLLWVETSWLWIRPDDDTAGNSFDNSPTSGDTITCNAHTDTMTAAAATTGESLWANIYSIGSISRGTHLYVYQNDSVLTSVASATDWWVDGHIDVLVKVKELDTEIDEAVITVFGRQYSQTYDNFIVDLSAGGRNPIPLATGNDLNNSTGYKSMYAGTSSGTWDVGRGVYAGANWGSASVKGVLTSVSGSNPTVTLGYYLLGGLDDFELSYGVFEYNLTTSANGNASAVAGTPADAGPALLSGLSITHGSDETFDIDEDGATENYSIVIDCSDERLDDVYEWSKYATMRGNATLAYTDGIEGEQYIGTDYRISYGSLASGSVSEGDVVTQDTTNATGTVIAHNATDQLLILRNSRGAFNNTDTVRVDANNYVVDPTSTAITAIKSAPFGTFAGGVWFCAPGVVLDNVNSLDANNFQLTDDGGNVVTAPTKVTVAVGNTRVGDKVAVYRLTSSGGNIEKNTYTVDTSQGAAGSATIAVDSAIDPEEPGKSTGGILFVVDNTNSVEDRYRYTAYGSQDFSLFTITGLTADGSSCTSVAIYDTGANFVSNGVKVGDILRNTSESAKAYVTEVESESVLKTTPVTDWTGDSYEVGTTFTAYTTSDKVYVPFIHTYETTGTPSIPGSESVSVTYSADIPVRIRARQAGNILPYEADSTIGGTGMSNNVIRTADSIYS